jgi:hypothetical protein
MDGRDYSSGSGPCMALLLDGSSCRRTPGGESRFDFQTARATKTPSLRANGSRERAPDDRLREAIQLAARKKAGLLRRFAPRNDGKTHPRDLAARFARALPFTFRSLEIRGRREDRVRAAPAVSCAICANKNAHEHTGSAETLRPSLRNGLTAYAALSPATNSFLSPSPAD